MLQRQKVEYFVRAPHLLIVEPKALLASLLKQSLATLGYEASIAVCGQAALQLLERTCIDLVLLDFILPDMDGYALCARIHEHDDKPIVATSESKDIGKALSVFSAGASAFVYKPFRLQDVAMEIQKALQCATLHRSRHFYNFPLDAAEQRTRAPYGLEDAG